MIGSYNICLLLIYNTADSFYDGCMLWLFCIIVCIECKVVIQLL